MARRFFALLVLAAACGGSATQTPPANPPPPGYAYGTPPPQGYPPQQGYPPPQQGYPPPQQGYPPPQQGYPPPAAGPTAAAPPVAPPPQGRPLLAPLVGSPMMQAEIRGVLDELIAHLSPDYAARVRGIPLKFDPDPEEVNAFAGCEQGAAYMAMTQGMLDALDGLSQTKATDELFGTQTYEAYANVVVPRLVQPKGGGAGLPFGTIPVQYLADPRRLSRAHELFDDVAAFTFGHELAHHYLGHTGCANGTSPLLQGLATLGHLSSSLIPVFNQPNELAADNIGLFSVMDTGRARRPQYEWTERGGLILLEFFARLERSAGSNPMLAFLRTHPPSNDRINWIRSFAGTWRQQHPG